MDKSC